jgi:NADPH-dependent 2,4-dienoyl-CoA reductase/sulfur reductase-like enzyme
MTSADESFDLGVIGAGPGGMAAGTVAAELGLRVAVFDEQPEPGGQIYRGIAKASPELKSLLGPDYASGLPLLRAFLRAGATRFSNATVTYVTDDLELGVMRDDVFETYRCAALIVATGALERPFPIPGWTLPGVLAAGGAQSLLKANWLIPEGRVCIAGTGPLAYLLANQLLAAGVRELAFLDTTPEENYRAAATLFLSALARPSYLAKGLRLVSGVRKKARPYVRNVRSLQARGAARVESVGYETARGSAEIATDWLLLHQGVVPNTQVTRALQCDHTWNADQLCWQPVIDEWGCSSRKGVLVAGDSGGILGADAAAASGSIAALHAAVTLGRLPLHRRDALARPHRRTLARLRRVRRFLDRLYRPLDAHRVPVGATIVCRCEDVTAEQARTAIAQGCAGPNQLKFFTRCGMGPCQGRYCGLTVSELIAQVTGKSVAEVGYYRVRQPLKPMQLGALASVARAIEKAAPYNT